MSFDARRQRILTFHGVGAPERDLEPGEAPYWIGEDVFCKILDRVAAHPQHSQIKLTFDDSNASDLTIAAPQLRQRGLSASFFVLTGRMGQRGSLGASEIRKLHELGMTIGSHGVGHRDWSALGPKELEIELVRSRLELEDVCGHAIAAASIPFGRYNGTVLRALRQAGYEAAYSSDGGTSGFHDFPQPRTSIRCDTTNRAVTAVLDGNMSGIRLLRRAAATFKKKHL